MFGGCQRRSARVTCRIKPEDSRILCNRACPDEFCGFLEMRFRTRGDEGVTEFDSAYEMAAFSRDLGPQQRVIGAVVEKVGEAVQVALESRVISALVTFIIPAMSVIQAPP